MPTTRPTWDEYFMGLARLAATRATCDRLHVGAVLVRDRRVIATGYNGSLPGLPHCDDVGHDLVDGHCVRTSHAEANAVQQAARHGVSVDGATLYVTAFPCWPCARMVFGAGVRRIVYADAYRIDARVLAAAESMGVAIDFAGEARPHDEVQLLGA